MKIVLSIAAILAISACSHFGQPVRYFQPGAALQQQDAIIVLGVHNIDDPVYLQFSNGSQQFLSPAFAPGGGYQRFILPAGHYQLKQIYLNRVPLRVPACDCLEVVSFDAVPGQINYIGEVHFEGTRMKYYSDPENFVQLIDPDHDNETLQLIMAHPTGNHAEVALLPVNPYPTPYLYPPAGTRLRQHEVIHDDELARLGRPSANALSTAHQ